MRDSVRGRLYNERPGEKGGGTMRDSVRGGGVQ